MDVASRASRASYRPKVQRVKSAELADLHVYIVPPDLWRERYNNLLNQNVTETISAGIIRVHPETRVCNLRDELETQLGAELLPRDFIFLKSVGRSITRLKPKQEFQLKVKHFLPPNSYAPELYLLEVENRDDENETTGSTRPTTRSPQFTEMLRSFTTREDERQSNRYRQKPRNATSPYRYTSPLPKIKSDRGGSQKTVESVSHFDQNGDMDGEKIVTVSNSWGGDTRRSPRRSPPTVRRSPPPRSPPPQNDYSHKQNEYPSQQNDYPPPQNDYPDTSRLNASPTHSGVTDKPVASTHQPVASKYDPRSATYTNQTNDSGIAGLTPEEYRDRENYDDAERRKNEYNESRQKELENRLNGDRMNGDLDDSDRQRRLKEDQEREEWERKNRDEDERRRREEEERRRREEEERQREEDERRRREEEREKMAREKLSGSDERQLQGRGRKGARSTHLTPMDPDWTKRGVHGDYDQVNVNQNDQKLDGPEGQRDDQAGTYQQTDKDTRAYEQRDDQTRAYGQTDKDTRAYRQSDDQTRSYERTDDKTREYGQTNDHKTRQANDQTRDYRRSNDQTRDYGQSNDQTRDYGQSNDQTRDYGQSNDQTRDYGQNDDQTRAYSNRDKTLNRYDQRQSKGSVAIPSDKFVQVALRPDPTLNEPVSDSELYSKEDISNSPRNTNPPVINFPQNNDPSYREGSQKKIYEGRENPTSHRQNEGVYSEQRYEPMQNNERNNDDIEETHSYTTGKVSKTFVKDGVEYRQSEDTNRQYQPSGTSRSVQQTRSSTRSYPRQETEDSVMPSTPSSDSDQKQYLLRKQQQTQDKTYSRVADTKNVKGKNIHRSSFPLQNQGGKPVIHHRKSNQRKQSDLNRFPSPPPMNVASTDQDMDSRSQNLTKEQKQAEKPEQAEEPTPVTEKEKTVIKKKPSFKKKQSFRKKNPEEEKRLLQELEAAREARRAVERQREELVKKAKLMQNKTQNRRNHDKSIQTDLIARDLWKKRYFEEKKRTPPLEEQCNKLRHELDVIHRKLMNALEGSSKDKNTRMENLKPSKQNNYKIQATRLTHEIDDLRRRLENAKMKLTAEMKLRNQAETELRALRAELTQKKIHLTLSRNQQMAMTPGGDSRYYRTPALSNKA
ncbi:trichohyalin-like isoform X3 [Mytilus californianus]|uniref:trichohyalin-like isoform X3 n=1 Tax=Mytilus californianus TaxID=6549 RepID=UPI002247A658|nr:trichohyalin-like isoform X3 [Mytilus californianus]